MSISVIDSECRIEDGKLVIVVEGKSPEDVLGPNAKSAALQKAATLGYTRIGINGQSGSYPVDAEGKSYFDENAMAREGKINGYRNEIKLLNGI